MPPRSMKRKCKKCREFFIPDPRNRARQKYCEKIECRKASKADSQRRWLKKPKNADYFKGPINVDRVRGWRKTHPGYWRRKKRSDSDALQDSCRKVTPSNPGVAPPPAKNALQDSLLQYHPVIIGLISNFTGLALQDDIASTLRRMELLGRDIINPELPGGGNQHDQKVPRLSREGPKGSGAVQLDRSTPDP